MYKIIKLNENELKEFKGKIINVIQSVQRQVDYKYDIFGGDTKIMLILTCLVEVEDER